MPYQYTNFIKELVEDDGKYFYMKEYYTISVEPKGATITLTLKDGKEMYTEVKKLVITYSKASFDTPLGRLEYYIAYNMKMEQADGYYEDMVISLFNNFRSEE